MFALLRVLAVFSVIGVVLAALLYSAYLEYTDISPPIIEVRESEFIVNEVGRQVTYGTATLGRQGRVWRAELSGSPVDIGHAHGQLLGRLLRELDTGLSLVLERRYGSWVERWTAAMLLRWDYRSVDRFIGEDARLELAALARTVPELQRGGSSAYHRLFLYQYFHGLAQRLDDIVLEGTLFAVSPRRSSTERGNLIVGHNISIDLGREFSTEPLLTIYAPEGRTRFVSVGWPGSTGVVTGVNAHGIVVALNAARTDDPLQQGAPLPLILRRVLEEADSLDRAVTILREADVRTSGIVLVGDGVARRSVIVEIIAGRRGDRRIARGERDATVAATNHMMSEVFESDLQNDWVQRYSSSGSRYARLQELLTDTREFDVTRAVSILRDRSGKNGTPLGLGNRNAIETLNLTQSVVIDATAMMLWVAEGPSALGRFQAFDLALPLGRHHAAAVPLDDLPADPLLYTEEYRDYQEALRWLNDAKQLLLAGHATRALHSAKTALALAPQVGELHRVLGDVQRELGHIESAETHYRRYLELVPGRRRDQVRVEGILQDIRSLQGPSSTAR